MFDFFIDTADIEYNKRILKSMPEDIFGNYLKGVTTNPNAMNKVSCHSLDSWVERTKELVSLMDAVGGCKKTVYVQLPNSKSPLELLPKFIDIFSPLSTKNTSVSFKIPPREDILREIHKYDCNFNVTGIADCATALKCAKYGMEYVSIIPGRMEQVGIDAKSHINFVNQSLSIGDNDTRIIAGSMRTIHGLFDSVLMKTVPTIGERVWNKIFELPYEDRLNIFLFSAPRLLMSDALDAPITTQTNIDLSLSFFDQMDEFGCEANKDLISRS